MWEKKKYLTPTLLYIIHKNNKIKTVVPNIREKPLNPLGENIGGNLPYWGIQRLFRLNIILTYKNDKLN